MRSAIKGAAAMLVALALAGCGASDGDGSADSTQQIDPLLAGPAVAGGGSSEAVELTRRLPAGAPVYGAVDLEAVKDGLGLPASTDPVQSEVVDFLSQELSGILTANPSLNVVEALQLQDATAMASSPDRQYEFVTAVRTSADVDDIRANLADLGFLELDGVLEGPNGQDAIAEPPRSKVDVIKGGPADPVRFPHRPIAVRFFDGGFLVSNSAIALRRLGEEADDLPIDVLNSLNGEMTRALTNGRACVVTQGITTNMDGTGRLVFVIDGDPDPDRFDGGDSGLYGEPTVSGDEVIVPIDGDEPESPAVVISETFPGYDC